MNGISDTTSGRIARRLIPFLMLCYIVAYLDRVNAGFAALTMNRELGITAEMFGFGVGIFFIGYFFFEVPSNLLLVKVGARRWIARIMISWGIISAAFAAVPAMSQSLEGIGLSFFDKVHTFYLLRFLLGAAEAGFFPGIILYLTYWFTAAERARWFGVFMAAVPLSFVIGGPVSGLILDHCEGLLGMNSWQWLFVIEGAPSVLVGILVLIHLTDKPADAHWLSPTERAAVQERIDRERWNREAVRRYSIREGLTSPRVFGLSLVYFGLVCGHYGLSYWLPQITKGVVSELGLDRITGISINLLIGLLVAVPSAFAIVAMVLWTRHSDKTGERIWHVACPAVLAGLSLIAAAHSASPTLSAVAIIVCSMASYAAMSTFWTLPTAFLTGSAAAGGIALINSIGNLGGFLGPYAIGFLENLTGTEKTGLVSLAICYLIAGAVTLVVGHDREVEIGASPLPAE